MQQTLPSYLKSIKQSLAWFGACLAILLSACSETKSSDQDTASINIPADTFSGQWVLTLLPPEPGADSDGPKITISTTPSADSDNPTFKNHAEFLINFIEKDGVIDRCTIRHAYEDGDFLRSKCSMDKDILKLTTELNPDSIITFRVNTAQAQEDLTGIAHMKHSAYPKPLNIGTVTLARSEE